jgi:hypothetical protein
MTLAELTKPEKVALLALLGLMARLDGQVFDDEINMLKRVASEIGPEDFEQCAAEAARLPDNESILETAKVVTRQDAREVIYELLFDMAVREAIAERESELLDWLAKTWDLPQRTGEAG